MMTTQRVEFACPLCDGTLDMTYRADHLGRERWLVGCFSCAKRLSSKDYLRAAAEELGCRPFELLKGPGGPIASLASAMASTRWDEAPEPLPSCATLAGWRERLWTHRDALEYLRERGLSDATIRSARLGYGRFGTRPLGVTIPVPPEGAVSNLKQRFWPEPWLASSARPCKSAGLRGRGAQLYPQAPAPGDAFVLCEGEFDALLLNQHRIRAITSTAGTSWLTEWDAWIKGCTIAVIYDVGSHGLAVRRAVQLVAAGAAEAWPVDLAAAGLTPGQDATDWFVTHHKSRRDLARLIRTSRSAWRAQGAPA